MPGCEACGAKVENMPNGKPRRFCSMTCAYGETDDRGYGRGEDGPMTLRTQAIQIATGGKGKPMSYGGSGTKPRETA
jgi:hypothetical protein